MCPWWERLKFDIGIYFFFLCIHVSSCKTVQPRILWHSCMKHTLNQPAQFQLYILAKTWRGIRIIFIQQDALTASQLFHLVLNWSKSNLFYPGETIVCIRLVERWKYTEPIYCILRGIQEIFHGQLWLNRVKKNTCIALYFL